MVAGIFEKITDADQGLLPPQTMEIELGFRLDSALLELPCAPRPWPRVRFFCLILGKRHIHPPDGTPEQVSVLLGQFLGNLRRVRRTFIPTLRIRSVSTGPTVDAEPRHFLAEKLIVCDRRLGRSGNFLLIFSRR